MIRQAQIGVVILAAGASRRLGRPKQLVQFQEKTLLQRVIDLVGPFEFSSKTLVLGARADDILAATDRGTCQVVINEGWDEGIASSIRLGIEQTLSVQPDTEHLLFLLSDQPFVSAALLHELLRTHLQGSQAITACSYHQEAGVPVLFARRFFSELQQLQGDRGAKRLLKRHSDIIAIVTFEDGHFDVDTEADVQRLAERGFLGFRF